MSTRTEVQTIRDQNGTAVYAVVPFAEYQALVAQARTSGIRKQVRVPHEVVSLMVDGASAARAWREHLGLTQIQLASRMKISQAALAQMEKSLRPRKATRAKLAAALRIRVEQLLVT
jgi:ribosome-binding protein aMBF1 (putative translation factor)